MKHMRMPSFQGVLQEKPISNMKKSDSPVLRQFTSRSGTAPPIDIPYFSFNAEKFLCPLQYHLGSSSLLAIFLIVHLPEREK